jgi:site-specific DNA-cytosine methylase
MVLTQDVKDVDPTVFKVDRSKLLTVQISPPCQSYSSANLFPDLTSDRALALDNCYHILDHLNPDRIIIENVRAYQKSEPMNRFRNWLETNDYNYIEQVVNCANIGVPQSRIRYFLMAVRKGEIVRHLPSTHSAKLSGQLNLFGDNLKPWVGWYEAIEDLIPGMAITKLSGNQQLALRDWELKHPTLIEGRTHNTDGRAVQKRFAFRHQTDPSITILAGTAASAQLPKLLIPTIGYHSDLPPIYSQHRLAPTVKAMMMSDGESERKGCWRLIDNCEVREMSVKGLARLQTFPDDMILSENKGLSCKAIGNAVCPIVLQQILEKCFD